MNSMAISSKLRGQSSSLNVLSPRFSVDSQRSNKDLSSQKSHKSIESSLMLKSIQSKSIIAEKRLKAKAEQTKEMREAPSQANMPKRMKSQEHFKLLKFVKKSQEKHEEKPSKNTIPPPDLSEIKNTISKLPPNKPEPGPDFLAMNLLEKTEFQSQKKQESLKQAQKLKLETELQQCSFRPDLVKPKLSPARSSPKAKISKPEKVKKKKYDLIRIPAPNKVLSSLPNGASKPQVFLSNHYSQFSPTNKVFSFKEGADVGELKNRCQDMMAYYVSTNRTDS